MIRKDGAPDMRFAWNQGPGCLSIVIFGGAGIIMIIHHYHALTVPDVNI